jgi:dimethylargininase
MTSKPRRAIVRPPGKAYSRCVSCHPLRDTVDLPLALEQHSRYCEVLSDLGLEIIRLPPDDSHADACFVEDTAVIFGEKALICRIGEPSRRGEEAAVSDLLGQFVKLRQAVEPATVDGGDVVHLQDRLISGLSRRTNQGGITEMKDWLDVRVDTVDSPAMMHLKSHITYLGGETMVSTEEFADHPTLRDFSVIVVPEDEAYAANTLTIGETVIMSNGRERTHGLVRAAGFEIRTLDMSEFEKCDGALTCLSLLV